MQKLLKTFDRYRPVAVDAVFLIVSFFTSLTLAPLVKSAYKNPYNISNPYNSAGLNPDNNYYVLFFVIVATVAMFFLLHKLYLGRFKQWIKVFTIVFIVLNFFFGVLLPNPSYTADGIIDNFHVGEQLSVTSAFSQGKSLYDGMFFLRGAGVDVIVPTIGMKIFGWSIGSFVVWADILQILALMSFLILLALLVRDPVVYAVSAVLLYVSGAVSLVEYRDIPVWLSVGLLILLFKKDIAVKWRRTLLATIGFIASINLYVSIDRAILLLVFAVLVFLVQLITKQDRHNNYAFRRPSSLREIAIGDHLLVLAGLLLGLFIPAAFLGWQSFMAFLRITFHDIPSYAGLLVSQPLPPLFSDQYLFWAPVFVSISAALLLISIYGTRDAKKHLNVLLPYAILLVLGILSIKVGANRIHIAKMASAVAPLYLSALLILLFSFTYFIKNKQARSALLLPIVLLPVVLIVVSQLNFAKLHQVDYSRAQIKNYRHIPQKNDNAWLDENTIKTKDYILENTKKDDYIFAFTSDPLYYYLTERKNPSRFYISWFADPQPYTDELLRDLKTNKPELIIYSEGIWTDAPDSIPMTKRTPEINEWIVRNYLKKEVVGNTVILSRN